MRRPRAPPAPFAGESHQAPKRWWGRGQSATQYDLPTGQSDQAMSQFRRRSSRTPPWCRRMVEVNGFGCTRLPMQRPRTPPPPLAGESDQPPERCWSGAGSRIGSRSRLNVPRTSFTRHPVVSWQLAVLSRGVAPGDDSFPPPQCPNAALVPKHGQSGPLAAARKRAISRRGPFGPWVFCAWPVVTGRPLANVRPLADPR